MSDSRFNDAVWHEPAQGFDDRVDLPEGDDDEFLDEDAGAGGGHCVAVSGGEVVGPADGRDEADGLPLFDLGDVGLVCGGRGHRWPFSV